MRILMVSPVAGDAFGQERVMRISSGLLRGAGHEVLFLADTVKGSVPQHDGLEVIPGLSRVNLLSARRDVEELNSRALSWVDKVKPDVIHFVDQFDSRLQGNLCRNYPTMLTSHLLSTTCPSSTRLIKDGGMCTKRSGYACLLHNHRYGCLNHFKNDLHRTVAIRDYLLRRASLTEAKVVGAISKYVERVLVQDGWPAKKIRLIYNPIEIPQAVSPAKDVPSPLILCVSRLELYKGIHILIEAISHLAELPWTLWICGEGAYKSQLVELVAKHQLEKRIRFLGWVTYENARTLMAASRMVVQPNLGPEPFGLSVAEASALGIPVIASDAPALTEIVSDGLNGLLSARGDANSLAEKIKLLLNNPSLAERLGKAGPDHVKKLFSPEQHLRSTLNAYQECLGKSSTGATYGRSDGAVALA